MTYVITEACIDVKDTACVDVCPVDCIHPTTEFTELFEAYGYFTVNKYNLKRTQIPYKIFEKILDCLLVFSISYWKSIVFMVKKVHSQVNGGDFLIC